MAKPRPVEARLTVVAQQQHAGEVTLTSGAVAYPRHWQVPAATEQAAWQAIKAAPGAGFTYVGFPWATLIDGLRTNAPSLGEVLAGLRTVQQALEARGPGRRVTVAQHIHAVQFIDLFRACGITDLCWSHAVRGQPEAAGIRIHPFPIFPAQAPALVPLAAARPRRWLANFIGAYVPVLYLSDVRQAIFELPPAPEELLIVRRNGWHFDRAVYEEQMQGRAPAADQLQREAQQAAEYLAALRDSWFTLCATGSGPNSIRIFESLALGSIPIVLSRELRLPGPPALWERAALVAEDSRAGLADALVRAHATTQAERLAMLRAGRELASLVLPGGYGALIRQAAGAGHQHGARDHPGDR